MAQLPITENPAFSRSMEQITAQERGEPGTFNPRYQVLLDNDNYLKGEIDRAIRGSILVVLPATGWSAAVPYTQTVSVAGVAADDSPILVKAISAGATPEQVKAYNKVFGMIDDGDTGDGTATFKCYSKKPTVDLTVGLKGV